jgi:hypothetical protein
MIEIPFGQFMDGKFEDGGKGYELYIVKRYNEILYVGISRANIWNRWFGGRGRIRKNAGGYWYSTDSIGSEIVENMPNSLCWMIELWTQEDCKKLFAADIINKGYHSSDRCDITVYEPMMIAKLSPSFNRTYNS